MDGEEPVFGGEREAAELPVATTDRDGRAERGGCDLKASLFFKLSRGSFGGSLTLFETATRRDPNRWLRVQRVNDAKQQHAAGLVEYEHPSGGSTGPIGHEMDSPYDRRVVLDESFHELVDDVIVLRSFGMDDVADVTAACQDAEIVRWTVRIPSPYTLDDASRWIEMHDELRASGEAYNFAIVDRADGRLSGAIGVEHPRAGPEGGLVGYWVAPWARNRGFARRALQLVSDWAFREFDVDALYLTTLVDNVASERVAVSSGFCVIEELDDYEHPGDAGHGYRVKRWTRQNTR